MNNIILGKVSTGGNVYHSYDTSSTGLTYKPAEITTTTSDDKLTVRCSFPEEELVYRGEKYRIDRVERSAESINPYAIKKVIANPKKNATTVIFKDGTVEVVKKSPDDPEADIFSVVAYAVAKRIYGSNSAFKREVKNCMIENSGGKE